MRKLTCSLFKISLILHVVIFICIYFSTLQNVSSSEQINGFHSSEGKKRTEIDVENLLSCQPTNFSISSRFKMRLKKLRRVCYKKLKENKQKILLNKDYLHEYQLIGSVRHHAMTCLVFKSGSSTLNDFFWKLRAPEEAETEEFWEKAAHGNRETFLQENKGEVRNLWERQDGIRILVTRHPMVRILSAYLDKFNKAFYHNTLFLKYPGLKKYPNKFGRWKGKGYFMKWGDFAKYVAEYGHDYKQNLDLHFQPITGACNPCVIPFNYVVKLETFNEDFCWLLKNRFFIDPTIMTKQNSRKKSISYQALVREYYSKLSADVIKKIYNVYKEDMMTFGYTFDLNSFKIGGWNT